MIDSFNLSPRLPDRRNLGYHNDTDREADAECLNDLAQFCHGQSFDAGGITIPRPVSRSSATSAR